MSELEDLYQDIIVDHFQNPRCFGCMKDKDAGAKLFNPLCGDQIDLCVKIEDDKIKKIVFSGKGCSISQAAASMMCELLEGKSISEAKELFELYQKMLKGEKQDDELNELGDLVALSGVRKFSARIKCAMLGWEAVQKALNDYLQGHYKTPDCQKCEKDCISKESNTHNCCHISYEQ